jgi:predicted cupin superfamily sugar epimerase
VTAAPSAAALIRTLRLRPHPEGGHYRETWRDKPATGKRGSGTAIYYLLKRGEESRWHRIDAVEIWHHYAGAPLALTIATGGKSRTIRLGADVIRGEQPQAIVPKGAWQSATSLGAWSLVGCTVSPAFDFAGFELAPEGFVPGRAQRPSVRKRRHIAR